LSTRHWAQNLKYAQQVLRLVGLATGSHLLLPRPSCALHQAVYGSLCPLNNESKQSIINETITQRSQSTTPSSCKPTSTSYVDSTSANPTPQLPTRKAFIRDQQPDTRCRRTRVSWLSFQPKRRLSDEMNLIAQFPLTPRVAYSRKAERTAQAGTCQTLNQGE